MSIVERKKIKKSIKNIYLTQLASFERRRERTRAPSEKNGA